MTNTTKANLIAATNAALGLLIAFGISVSGVQQAAIVTAANAGLILWVGLTYKRSSKRTAD